MDSPPGTTTSAMDTSQPQRDLPAAPTSARSPGREMWSNAVIRSRILDHFSCQTSSPIDYGKQTVLTKCMLLDQDTFNDAAARLYNPGRAFPRYDPAMGGCYGEWSRTLYRYMDDAGSSQERTAFYASQVRVLTGGAHSGSDITDWDAAKNAVIYPNIDKASFTTGYTFEEGGTLDFDLHRRSDLGLFRDISIDIDAQCLTRSHTDSFNTFMAPEGSLKRYNLIELRTRSSVAGLEDELEPMELLDQRAPQLQFHTLRVLDSGAAKSLTPKQILQFLKETPQLQILTFTVKEAFKANDLSALCQLCRGLKELTITPSSADAWNLDLPTTMDCLSTLPLLIAASVPFDLSLLVDFEVYPPNPIATALRIDPRYPNLQRVSFVLINYFHLDLAYSTSRLAAILLPYFSLDCELSASSTASLGEIPLDPAAPLDATQEKISESWCGEWPLQVVDSWQILVGWVREEEARRAGSQSGPGWRHLSS